MEKHILVIDAQDHSGVLSRIATVFNRRAMNIKTFTAGASELEGITRITLAMEGAGSELEIMKRQISKIIGVEKIVELNHEASFTQELLIANVKVPMEKNAAFDSVCDKYGVMVVSFVDDVATIKAMDTMDQLHALTKALNDFEIIGYHRTGQIAI